MSKTDKMKMELTDTVRIILSDLYYIQGEFSVKVIKYSENVTFLVNEASTGKKKVFRVNRPKYHNSEELQGEIDWMNEISDSTDLILPDVYKGIDGNYIQSFNHNGLKYSGVMFSFLEGIMVGNLKGDELKNQMRENGKILAKLHIQSKNREKNKLIKRSSWGIEDLFSENAKWGTWRDYKELTISQIELLEKAEKIIISRLREYQTTSDKYGLIHADLHCSNVIVNNGISQVFDFDDCGYGWYLYDLGCSLVEYNNPYEFLPYILEGYETVRKLSLEDKNLIDMFLILRRIIRFAWISGHADSDTVKGIENEYFDETFKMVAKFVS